MRGLSFEGPTTLEHHSGGSIIGNCSITQTESGKTSSSQTAGMVEERKEKAKIIS